MPDFSTGRTAEQDLNLRLRICKVYVAVGILKIKQGTQLALYRLSYAALLLTGGLEPPTSPLKVE